MSLEDQNDTLPTDTEWQRDCEEEGKANGMVGWTVLGVSMLFTCLVPLPVCALKRLLKHTDSRHGIDRCSAS